MKSWYAEERPKRLYIAIKEAGTSREVAGIPIRENTPQQASELAHLLAKVPDMVDALKKSHAELVNLRDNHLDHTAAVVKSFVQYRIEQIESLDIT